MIAAAAIACLLAAPADLPSSEQLGFVKSYKRVAMMPLSSLGSTDEVVQAIQQVLVAEVENILKGRLVKPDALLSQGAAAKEGFAACEGVVTCLVEVFGGLGWDAFVVGNVAGLGEDRIIILKLFDVRTGSEVRRATEGASGDEKTLIDQMRRAAVNLLAPDMLVGAVDLQCDQPGVKIAVDGQVIGTTPLANARLQVGVGRHAIEASADGRVPFSQFVEVAYGETKTVEIVLPDNTVFVGGDTPFRARWWTWTLAGAGVVVAGLGGFFNYLQVDTVNGINARANNGTLTIDQRDLFRREEEYWLTAVTLYAVGGAVLTTVGILLGIDLVAF